ncbi:hypothetical protein [Eremococcus coleocola]|uniref:Uncharacterized protein n=1 Tax=Eremococcus coleocola ACS-139-V-Col8 TaxID=908337 RepID=E4KLN5_9LACT|nr:hypothetical protein [Eremococcus coleocola]EFR32134.1 hypothetical protein HMPREF9257_0867 [Eremococcus coleocola ACS-139-V-Col8]
MTKVYTNFWHSRRDNVIKQHGSYKTEDEALEGIKAWWEIHKEKFEDMQTRRTNSGALEITYLPDDNYYYRIEAKEIEGALPSAKPKKRSKGEIEKLRSTHQLNEEAFLFEELPEPYQDRLIICMNDGKALLNFTYDQHGRPIKRFA